MAVRPCECGHKIEEHRFTMNIFGLGGAFDSQDTILRGDGCNACTCKDFNERTKTDA